MKFFQSLVGRTFRQPGLAHIQVKLRRILANRQHLVEGPLLQNRIGRLARRDAKDIKVIQVVRFPVPEGRKSIDGIFVLI